LDQLAQMALHEDWPEVQSVIASWQHGEMILKSTKSRGMQEILSTAAKE
jgi:hypothetical protein